MPLMPDLDLSVSYCRSSQLCMGSVPVSCDIKPCTSCQIVESRILCYYIMKHSFLPHVSWATPCWVQDCRCQCAQSVCALECAQGGHPGAYGEDRTCLVGEQRGRSPRPAWLSGCCLWALCFQDSVCVCVCVCVCAVKCVLVMQYSQLQVVLKTRKTLCKLQVGVRNLENV